MIPNILKIKLPAKANAVSTRKQVMAARRARRRRSQRVSSIVIARNAGIAANGSTRKKIELNVTNENCKPLVHASPLCPRM